MIKVENIETFGLYGAMRGMRNPLNSWDKADTTVYQGHDKEFVNIGVNDLNLATRLIKAGTEHRKFLRMIHVQMDVTAPLYWWKEADTYKVGTTANSCSTMHKIQAKEFTVDDFSTEHLYDDEYELLKKVIEALNGDRELYLESLKKNDWWQMIQLLPSSYNQTRNVMLNYEVLANIYKSRKDHKLDEWRDFCKWIKSLPYSELIIGE